MQKILFGIFAHPDDEAFGPVATLLKEADEGTEIHLIVLTAGENGTNPDNLPNLGEVRIEEWRAAGKLIGASSQHHFGYVDGSLNNIDHIEITARIVSLVKEVLSGRADVEIEFMSLDLNGYTGHVDHIVAARSACLAFYRLRDEGLRMTRIRLACMSTDDVPQIDTSFVFMESGRGSNEIDEIIDGREYTDRIDEIMRCHYSQRADYENAKALKGERLGMNYFVVKD